MDTRIYVMTHKKIAEIQNEIYIPMQVGKAGKESLGYLADDTGDNISAKNVNYCELTGIYWIWKNVECDVVGICHYRRYFIRNENLLEKKYIENLLQNYSIIVPENGCVKASSVYKDYDIKHCLKDLDLCRQVIAEKYSEYIPAFDFSMQIALMSPANMWITKKHIYDRYCEWLFDILFEVENRIDMTEYDDYQKRVMGFLSERLFRVWLMMQPEAVTEEYVKMLDPQDLLNAEKRKKLICQCVKLKIKPVLQIFETETWKSNVVPDIDSRDNFEEKIPVWICWWQGEHDMPLIVKRCIASLKRNLPQDKTVIRFITLENCMQYVTFTESIIRKFNEGKITDFHLSELLRAELLYRYGGFWIDAAYYISSPIPEKLFERNVFYTLKFNHPVWDKDNNGSRWSADLWRIEKEHFLFAFLLASLWYYWEVEEVADGCLLDELITVAFDEFHSVRCQLEQCSIYEGDIFELSKKMNLKYTPERLRDIKQNSLFHRVDLQSEYRKENVAGEQTIYGYITTAEI